MSHRQLFEGLYKKIRNFIILYVSKLIAICCPEEWTVAKSLDSCEIMPILADQKRSQYYVTIKLPSYLYIQFYLTAHATVDSSRYRQITI